MRPLLALPLLLAVAVPVAAQQPPARPCTAPEHRQFDFWVGDWEVTNPAGKVAGHNRITLEFNDCVLRESWTGAGGMMGSSFNIYDARTGRWHQTWVDGNGMLLLLDGGLNAEGAMVLEGDGPAQGGGTARNRITWTPTGSDEVRQLWEVSTDAGATWQVVFDGRYRRVR